LQDEKMTEPAKFLFDTHLDGPAAPPPVAFDKVEEMRQQHEMELQRVREQALEQGREEGKAEAETRIEAELTRQLERLMDEKEHIERQISEMHNAINADAMRVAIEAADKLANGLIARHPAAHVEHFFKICLAMLPMQADLRLHVTPQLAAVLQPRLDSLIKRSGLKTDLIVVADEDIVGADCRLLWNEGGIDQQQTVLTEKIKQVVEAYLTARDSKQQASKTP
jgi:flagellar biosynthesis/type III secretory pathway protein FliH